MVASIDADTAVPRILDVSGGGVAVAPDDAEEFIAAIRALAGDPDRATALGRSGRAWVEREASPRAVGTAYDTLLRSLR